MDLNTVVITACTGVVSCHPKTTLHVSPVHPHDTSDDKKTLGRWTHLPFYNDWKLYIRYKCKKFLKFNEKFLNCSDILIKATDLPTWCASVPPEVVQNRVPGPDFKVTKRGYLAYQHPALTRASAGLKTLREHNEEMEKERMISEREDEVDAAIEKEYEAWERRGYKVEKEITIRTCGTEERRKANLARWGYSMDEDPRFNGEHEAHGYDGVGADPCDARNNRNWLLNTTLVGPAPVQKSAKKNRK